MSGTHKQAHTTTICITSIEENLLFPSLSWSVLSTISNTLQVTSALASQSTWITTAVALCRCNLPVGDFWRQMTYSQIETTNTEIKECDAKVTEMEG